MNRSARFSPDRDLPDALNLLARSVRSRRPDSVRDSARHSTEPTRRVERLTRLPTGAGYERDLYMRDSRPPAVIPFIAVRLAARLHGICLEKRAARPGGTDLIRTGASRDAQGRTRIATAVTRASHARLATDLHGICFEKPVTRPGGTNSSCTNASRDAQEEFPFVQARHAMRARSNCTFSKSGNHEEHEDLTSLIKIAKRTS